METKTNSNTSRMLRNGSRYSFGNLLIAGTVGIVLLGSYPNDSAEARMAQVSTNTLSVAELYEIKIAPTLKGSKKSMDAQNIEADREHLPRIKDAEKLKEYEEKGYFAQLPENSNLQVDPKLPALRRYALPWVDQFLLALGQAHSKAFPNAEKLTVTSAIRPLDVQEDLIKGGNKNASTRSVHPTGAVVDICYGEVFADRERRMPFYNGMSSREMAWMNHYLLNQMSRGRIIATRENKEPCYHIMVFRDPLLIERIKIVQN
jgi:hypothetical protein